MSKADGPALVLAEKILSFCVPSLEAICARIATAEEYDDFVLLIKQFLPERLKEILKESTPSSQMAKFASYFEDRYFSLWEMIKDGMLESYDELLSGVPIIVMGLSWESYEEIASGDWRNGVTLMTYIVDNPTDDEGMRIALVDACSKLVPAESLQLMPKEGFKPKELHKLLDKTPHKGLAIWADVLHESTNNYFMDTNEEMLGSSGLPDWTKENVEALTTEWKQAEVMNDDISKTGTWLEEKPKERFIELVKFILDRKEKHGSKAKST